MPAKPTELSRPKAFIVITDSTSKPGAERHEFRSVDEAFTEYERLRHNLRHQNRDRYKSSPDMVHFFDATLYDTSDPAESKMLTRCIRIVTPNGEWTDAVAHLWLTEGVPRWITTRGDYTDPNQPVVNYHFG